MDLLGKSLLTGLLALSSAAVMAAAVPDNESALSFNDARDRLHQTSDIHRSDNAQIARAQYESDAAKMLGGPKVTLSVKQVWGTKTLDGSIDTPIKDVADMVRPGLDALPPSLSAGANQVIDGLVNKFDRIDIHHDVDLSGPRATLEAQWPIYTGGLIAAQQSVLGLKVNESRAARDTRLNTMDAELAGRYWGVQLARSIEALRQSILDDENKEVDRAKKFEKKGLISRIERMSVEVARDKARRELATAATNARVAETELMNSLHRTTLPVLSTPLFVLNGDLGTLSSWKETARAQSPILSRMRAVVSQANEGVNVAKAGFKPKIFAFGSRNLIHHYLSITEPDWIAGIGVSYTLWDNRDRSDRLSAANATVNAADAARDEALNQVSTAVEVAFLRVTQAREEYELSQSTVNLARENLRLRQAAFAEGLSTANDLDTARTQLTAAQIAKRAAAYKFVVNWAVLHAASGTMDRFADTLLRSDLIASH